MLKDISRSWLMTYSCSDLMCEFKAGRSTDHVSWLNLCFFMQNRCTETPVEATQYLYKNHSYGTSESADYLLFHPPTTFPCSLSWLSTRSPTPRSMKPPTNQRAFPQPKKSLCPTRNVFWFASWTVVYCPLLASCTCSHVSLPASRVSVGFIIATPDLDRSNLGNARLQGLPADVLGGDPTGKRFDWVNSVFFFSYVSTHPPCARNLKRSVPHLRFEQVLCPVPATILAKLFPPRIYLGCAAIGWGICSTLMVSRLFRSFERCRDHIHTTVHRLQPGRAHGRPGRSRRLRGRFWPRYPVVLLWAFLSHVHLCCGSLMPKLQRYFTRSTS